MLAVLALWPAKYLGLIAVFALVAARLEPFGERRLGQSLRRAPGDRQADGLGAGVAMLDALAGKRMLSARYLGTVLGMTLVAYPLVFLLALSWSDDFRGLMLASGDDGGARGSALAQLGWFWLLFGPPASFFALGLCQVTGDWLGQRMAPGAFRLVAFAVAGALATVAVLWLLYLGVIVLAGPDDGAPLPVDMERATSSLVYALAFQLTAGVYAYAAFLPLALALAAAIAARVPRQGPAIPTAWRPALPALALTGAVDLAQGLGLV